MPSSIQKPAWVPTFKGLTGQFGRLGEIIYELYHRQQYKCYEATNDHTQNDWKRYFVYWCTREENTVNHTGQGSSWKRNNLVRTLKDGKNLGDVKQTPCHFATSNQLTVDSYWASLVAQLVKNLPTTQETWVRPLVGKIPWRRKPMIWYAMLC